MLEQDKMIVATSPEDYVQFSAGNAALRKLLAKPVSEIRLDELIKAYNGKVCDYVRMELYYATKARMAYSSGEEKSKLLSLSVAMAMILLTLNIMRTTQG